MYNEWQVKAGSEWQQYYTCILWELSIIKHLYNTKFQSQVMKQEYRNTTKTIPINVTQYLHIKFDFMKLENSGLVIGQRLY